MRSLTSLHESRTCSPQNFWSPVQNDFCNKIGHEGTHALHKFLDGEGAVHSITSGLMHCNMIGA
jgi:hypothetical protein